ncbi:SusD/RagB family nutrient-binding outer membrane lipoprotein [Christiangramia forsetii]|uniref:SusD/RagB family protein n=2 Tax=Christiangramia forsetii TaxID=411153 RepID=A0M514_CHRFK|nr:SusD/RagB family nutrient-binding outer membrane lipoprotein [Christiangramia forsetii]GGG22096.1 hypothetical protein GCM10011532_01450 [Christiangramia forsetii]CAL67709.1 conserved hypothetical protein [Christiangramia forsetii KT0803]
MKFKIKKYKYVIFAFAFSFTACDDYLDINENPNNPSEAPLAGLMVNSTFESSQNTFRMGDITSNYVQHLASPNPGSSSDVMDPVSYSGTWASMYNAMTDINDMMLKAEEEGANHYLGIGQILMAYNLATTVDAWGAIPYNEGFNFVTITPAYDNDDQLYSTVLNLLNSGISNLATETENSVEEDDFIYQGDISKWIKFGNMLKARYLNHYSETEQYDPASVLTALENAFESSDDDAQVEYFAEEINPWADVAIDNANLFLGGWISEQFIEATDGTTFGVLDPRLPYMVSTTEDGEYVGTLNGAGRGDAAEEGERSVLEPGDYYTTEQGPVLMATYFEQKFIEAEAAFSIDKDQSYQAYLDGIRAHMVKIGVPADEIEDYINTPEVSMGVESFTIADIFKEKWVAMFLHPEAWVDARRYDYDYENFSLPENVNPDLNGMFIKRLAYPDSEVSRNGNNVPNVTLLDPIFWDE